MDGTPEKTPAIARPTPRVIAVAAAVAGLAAPVHGAGTTRPEVVTDGPYPVAFPMRTKTAV